MTMQEIAPKGLYQSVKMTYILNINELDLEHNLDISKFVSVFTESLDNYHNLGFWHASCLFSQGTDNYLNQVYQGNRFSLFNIIQGYLDNKNNQFNTLQGYLVPWYILSQAGNVHNTNTHCHNPRII